MAVRNAEKEIDGLRVFTTQLDAVRASRLLARLGKILGPTVVELASALAGGGSIGGMELAKLAPALGEAFSKLEDLEHDKLMLSILAGTEVVVDDKKINLLALDKINRAFDGKLGALYKTLWFVLEENYRDFFPAGVARNPSDARAAEAATRSQLS